MGGVEFEAFAGGLPVRAQRIDVFSPSWNKSVAAWVSEARVQVEPSDSKTDGKGRLRIDGLPNGAFEWSLTTLAGDTHQSTANVPHGALTRVPIVLP